MCCGIFLLLALLVGGAIYLFVLSPLSLVSVSLMRERRSPGGKLTASLYETDGGATGYGGFVVSIRPSWAKFNSYWDTVVCSTRCAAVDIEWKDDCHLLITGLVADGFPRATAYKNVQIVYP